MVDQRNEFGTNLLEAAVSLNNGCSALVYKDHSIIKDQMTQMDSGEMTPLHFAFYYGRVEMIRFWMEAARSQQYLQAPLYKAALALNGVFLNIIDLSRAVVENAQAKQVT